LKLVTNAIKHLGHALYNGEIYTKAEKAQYAFTPLCTVDTYMQKLLKNPVLQDDIINHLPTITKIFSNKSCEVINQLQLQHDICHFNVAKRVKKIRR